MKDVTRKSKARLMWHTAILTGKRVICNLSDCNICTQGQSWMDLLNVAVFCDKPIVKMEQAKIQRCQNLFGVFWEIYQATTRVVPFLVGAFGIIFRNSSALMDILEILDTFASSKMTVLLGTVHSLTKGMFLYVLGRELRDKCDPQPKYLRGRG